MGELLWNSCFHCCCRHPCDAAHFVTECFFVTQRLMHSGLIPALNRYANMWEDLHNKARRDGQAGTPSLSEYLLHDCTETQLLDPGFAGDALKFSVLEAIWLLKLIRQGHCEAFSIIPESVVHDIGSWLIFVIRHGQALLYGDVDISLLMESLVELIERKDLVKSPLVSSKIVELMSAMIAPTVEGQQRSAGRLFGRIISRPGEETLVAAVLGTGRESIVVATCSGSADIHCASFQGLLTAILNLTCAIVCSAGGLPSTHFFVAFFPF